MITASSTKVAQRCALVWFAISSEEVFEALRARKYEDIRHLGLTIDQEAFNDVSAMLTEKSDYENNVRGVRELWRIWCSPPPCKTIDGAYQELFKIIERSFELQP